MYTIMHKILEEFLFYVLSIVTALNTGDQQIPKHLEANVSYFEDAFGKSLRIDIDIVPNWAVSTPDVNICRD